MRPILVPLLLAAALWAASVFPFATAAAIGDRSTPAAESAIDAATSAILRGTADEALAALAKVPADQFAGKDATFRACTFARFERQSPPRLLDDTGDPFASEVLRLYRDYWWHALKAPARRDAHDQQLLASLRTLIGAEAGQAHDFEALEPILDAQLRRRGFHPQTGRTQPLRELMLWRKQDSRRYPVQLPEGTHDVQVELLDDFASRGWSAYGRCERGSVAGWATDKALYAVVPAYDKDGGLDSEAFRVVFLGHEAQHFVDQNRYPGIQPWELEYRAKLVELAQAREVSAKRLRSFITAQGDDQASPHTYANKRVVAALTARLGKAPDQVPIDDLQKAAVAELRADSARRQPRNSGGMP